MNKEAYFKRHSDRIGVVSLGGQTLSLIASGNNCEVMIQDIHADDLFGVSPPEIANNLFEFFYILSGKVSYLIEDASPVAYSEGDYFYFNNCKNSYVFQAVSDVKLMYFSSSPVFESMGLEYQELIDMVSKVEEKDVYTREHSSRVCKISVLIAEDMALSPEIITRTYYSAMFHDIGKIHITSEILAKPSKLTDEEYEAIKLHVENCISLLEPVKNLDIAEIIMQHHERNDGSGYPKGLTENEILIEAKIIAVADSFDAMTSNRSYRTASPLDLVINELTTLAGKSYDLGVVNSLKKLIISGKIK